MHERTFTLTTALCGVAGAIVMACTSAPSAAEPPPLHGCHQLTGHFTTLHADLRRGVAVPILRYLTLTDANLGDTGRAVVLHVLQAVEDNPGIKLWPASKFVTRSIDFCIASADTTVPVDLQRSRQQQGDI